MQPLNPWLLFKVTNTPDLKEKLFLKLFSSFYLVPFFRYSVTIVFAAFTIILPSLSDNFEYSFIILSTRPYLVL